MIKYILGFIFGVLFTFFVITSGCTKRDDITDPNQIILEDGGQFSIGKFVFETNTASDTLRLPFLINEHDVLIYAYRSVGGNPNYLSPTRNYRFIENKIWINSSGDEVKLLVLDLGPKTQN